jgi:hypothetical protein
MINFLHKYQNTYQAKLAPTVKELKILKEDMNNIMRRIKGISVQEFKDTLPDMLEGSRINNKIL